ncbi:MAG: hypothetical protein KKB59_18550 [Spirochaetes bacterium]|nr:hypothetical protein [Spirochaetota bacterium]
MIVDKICNNCEFYYPNCYANNNKKDMEWGDCYNPKLSIEDNNSFIRAGGSDGDGDYFHVLDKFGCIFWEGK